MTGAKIKRLAKEEAAKEGLLPHEWLTRVMRGAPIKQRRLKITYYEEGPKAGQVRYKDWLEENVYPDIGMRIDCAKAAAPYYAPKLSAQAIDLGGKEKQDVFAELFKQLGINLPG